VRRRIRVFGSKTGLYRAAWHSLFIRQLLIRRRGRSLRNSCLTAVSICRDSRPIANARVRSENVVAIDFARQVVLPRRGLIMPAR